ncbi:MAG TPA: chemotaxis protein CheD, partial [Longimicrobium sp.]|nr:chemotaxis protein CheD [Longimicrobium sp.]
MKQAPTYVKVAQYAVGGADQVLATLGLGSCVAILLRDPVVRVGGMAHVLLPEPNLSRDMGNPFKFATTA